MRCAVCEVCMCEVCMKVCMCVHIRKHCQEAEDAKLAVRCCGGQQY